MGEGSCLEIWGLGSRARLRWGHGPSPLGMRSWDSPAGPGLCCLPPSPELVQGWFRVTQERHTGMHKGKRHKSHFFRPKIPTALEQGGNVQARHPALPVFPVKHLNVHA